VLVLILEDLQWSDHATVEALASLAQRPEPARLLVLGTYWAAACLHQALAVAH
jgi:predicted ATPase